MKTKSLVHNLKRIILFNNLKDKVTQYFQIRFEELRLEIFERIVRVAGYILFILVSIFFMVISLVFLGFGLAAYLGEVFNSMPLAYLTTFGVFFLLGIVLLLIRKSIIKFFANRLISIMSNKSEDNTLG